MRAYAACTRCRRAALLAYFGEAPPGGAANCGSCDVCLAPAHEAEDVAPQARLLLEAVRQTGGRYGAGVPVSVLMGSKSKEVTQPGRAFHTACSVYGKGAGRPEKWWKALLEQLLAAGLLAPETKTGGGGGGGAYTVYGLSPRGRGFLDSEEPLRLPQPPEMRALLGGGGGGGGGGSGGGAAEAAAPLTGARAAAEQALRQWRGARAQRDAKARRRRRRRAAAIAHPPARHSPPTRSSETPRCWSWRRACPAAPALCWPSRASARPKWPPSGKSCWACWRRTRRRPRRRARPRPGRRAAAAASAARAAGRR